MPSSHLSSLSIDGVQGRQEEDEEGEEDEECRAELGSTHRAVEIDGRPAQGPLLLLWKEISTPLVHDRSASGRGPMISRFP